MPNRFKELVSKFKIKTYKLTVAKVRIKPDAGS
jgi:hypothetical protein